MCRNIRTLFNFEPPAIEEEIRAASLQFVRKRRGHGAARLCPHYARCSSSTPAKQAAVHKANSDTQLLRAIGYAAAVA